LLEEGLEGGDSGRGTSDRGYGGHVYLTRGLVRSKNRR